MAKLIALSLSLCFLLFSGCLAFRQQPEENECQFNRINALEPDNRIESEAGLIETWNPFSKQFRCAGVAFSRCTLQRNALRRPFYSNAPQEIFIQQGSGYFGMIFPGCPSTYEEPQESQRERGQGQSVGDRHQKVHKFREGDVIAVPTGVAFWMFNEQETPVVAVSVIDTSSIHNQLDQIPRRFYLAGNQENEFLQYVQEQSDRRSQIDVNRERQQSRREGQQGRRGHQGQEQEEEDENENGNVLSGFSPEFLEQAFQINREIVRSLQGKNEDEEKGAIVKVKGGLSIISPPMRQQRQQRRQEREEDEDEDEDEYDQQQQQEEQQRRRRRPHHGGRGGRDDENGLEETLCTLRLRSNIGQRASPDIYNPQAGRVRVVNDLDFPALRWLGLSAEYGSLNRVRTFFLSFTVHFIEWACTCSNRGLQRQHRVRRRARGGPRFDDSTELRCGCKGPERALPVRGIQDQLQAQHRHPRRQLLVDQRDAGGSGCAVIWAEEGAGQAAEEQQPLQVPCSPSVSDEGCGLESHPLLWIKKKAFLHPKCVKCDRDPCCVSHFAF